MALHFGTSGVRGLVTEMTDRECYLYARAFVRYVKEKTTGTTSVALAGDYRSSTTRILRAVACGIRAETLDVDYCGLIATPALANYGIRHGRASIMVTGSHIPDDRNGIKFNMPWGEVLKNEEGEISRRHAELDRGQAGRDNSHKALFARDGSFETPGINSLGPVNSDAEDAYIKRFAEFFPSECMQGLRVVFYQHSSVSRDILPHILEALGSQVMPVGFSKTFVPLDTENIEDPEKLSAWVRQHEADALLSTDGDGDRPLVVDERGRVIRGDVLGILVAASLGADSVSAPVSCNTALEKCGRFSGVSRTRIGSPYVIASLNEAVSAGKKAAVGYEANGGFLTASDIEDLTTGAVLKALPTRDAALPILSVLLSSLLENKKLSELVAALPPRFTASGLLRGFPEEKGKALVERFQNEGEDLANEMFAGAFGPVESMNFTDGARVIFVSGDIVHLRPSGNAPEFRCYAESFTEDRAGHNNRVALDIIAKLNAWSVRRTDFFEATCF